MSVRGFPHVRTTPKEERMSSRPYWKGDRQWPARLVRLAAAASVACSAVVVMAKSWPL